MLFESVLNAILLGKLEECIDGVLGRIVESDSDAMLCKQ